ncbi:hypothetical protein KIW84_034796 [Lathyrus oleraceus]|uniref:Uncharacterized protein n=1 Tax=Pisum sativum TaxID=3888 RepID=A0A9D4Y3P0_PEA|nr:hypothetical protein KIW84_034796 [Pisum sativum]
MSNNKDTGTRLLRNKTTYTFYPFDLSKLQGLSKRVVGKNVEAFTNDSKAREIEASVCFAKKKNPELLERVKTSWRKIHNKGKVFFRPKENVALHPYVAWIKKRVEALKLPFEREEPFYKQLSQLDSDEPVMIPIEHYRQLQAENYKTQAKKDEMGMQLYQVDQERR